jgi:hypothetical protein
MTQILTITNALAQAMCGEPAPSFRSAEFRTTISALTALTAPGAAIDAHGLHLHEQVGRVALSLLLDRFLAAMTAERAVAIMRSDKPDPVC